MVQEAELDAAHPSAEAAGNLSCMRWTATSCRVLSCKSKLGPTVCQGGYCMCQLGYCAGADGVCAAGAGRLLGRRSIRFRRPYVEARPFLGAKFQSGLSEKVDGYVASLASLARDAVENGSWEMAMVDGGSVRIGHTSFPDSALTIYENRRRHTSASLLAWGAARWGLWAADDSEGIPDDHDLWPVLVSLEFAKPQDVTFQVRAVAQNESALEIWFPSKRATLASADPKWWANDEVAGLGVAECRKPLMSSKDKCQGRQLVSFEPALPPEALYNPEEGSSSPVWGALAWLSVLACSSLCWFPCCFPKKSEEMLDYLNTQMKTPAGEALTPANFGQVADSRGDSGGPPPSQRSS